MPMCLVFFLFENRIKSKLKSLAHRGVRLRASAGQRRPRCASRSTVSLKSGVLLARVTSAACPGRACGRRAVV